MKKINTLTTLLLCSASLLATGAISFAQSPENNSEEPPEKPIVKKKKKKEWTPPPLPLAKVGLHPLFELQNLDVLGDDRLKVGGMCFHGESLYIATLSPNRTNVKPFHGGKILRIDNIRNAGKDGQKIKITEVCKGLYEPCSIGIIGDSIYVGEKHRIIRFDQGTKKNELIYDEAVVIIDGTSTENFHTYTVGFETFKREGKTYLCGNFTTAIRIGGARDKMTPQNPKIHRGSTFIFGPLTGTEKPADVEIEFLAGGFRTPNGIEVGPDNAVYVADNQGVFNPSNEILRIEPGSFYGHFLYTNKGRAAAFQPKNADPKIGNPEGQQLTTVHLPQTETAKSPAQPHVIRNRKGVLAPYNGQLLVCAFTKGEILRVSMEQVAGIWQGVAFRHSAGVADAQGNNGFIAGPNRIEEGPDGHYYIGEIGAGGLWQFNNKWHGLQRFAVKKNAPKDFNEIVDVNVVEGGFKLTFYQPIPEGVIKASDVKISQWTYHPTQNYGGGKKGHVKLKTTALTFSKDRTSATLIVNGLKDGKTILTSKDKKYSSINSGWVTNVVFDPKLNGKSIFHSKEFWYTLHRKIGGEIADASDIIQMTSSEKIKQKYQTLCISCHCQNDAGWGAPNLVGILGRKQTVIRNGKELKLTIDEDYLINAIMNPDKERPKSFKDAAMPPLGIKKKEAKALVEYIKSLK